MLFIRLSYLSLRVSRCDKDAYRTLQDDDVEVSQELEVLAGKGRALISTEGGQPEAGLRVAIVA
jgi:hypothetical protein